MNRVIITGGNGFIGKHVVKKFLRYNLQSLAIISISKFTEGYLSNNKLNQDLPLRSYTADIRDRKAILDIFLHEKVDTCIHLAAKISVSDSLKNPEETMEVNVKGTANVLEACQSSKVANFVFASSAAVYGDVCELPISENASLEPLSPYGTSKMLAEELVFRYNKQHKIQNTASLRIFNVYGSDNLSESDVISRFASRLSNGLSPIVHGDGNHTRDFISVEDVAEGILLSVKAMEGKNSRKFDCLPVFNIGSGNGTSINEIARKMISISGLQLDPIYKSEIHELGIILHSYADMTKTKRYLNFVAKKNLETGLKEIIKQKIVKAQKNKLLL